MNMQKIDNSSNIVSAGYDPASQKMHVEFKSGQTYEYEEIAPDEWAKFEETFSDPDASTGAHFGKNFRGRGGRKLEEAVV